MLYILTKEKDMQLTYLLNNISRKDHEILRNFIREASLSEEDLKRDLKPFPESLEGIKKYIDSFRPLEDWELNPELLPGSPFIWEW